jgi:hypothetical protein
VNNVNIYVSCFGVRIRCSVIHKVALLEEVMRRRSSQAQWTAGEWLEAMDSVKKMRCWGTMCHGGARVKNGKEHTGMKYSNNKRTDRRALERSSRAVCEWTMTDWRAEIKIRGGLGQAMKYHYNGN